MTYVAISQEMNMVYSRAQRTGLVHIYRRECDTDFGKAAACVRRVAAQNAESGSTWDISRNMASLTLCQKCRKKWPTGATAVWDT